MRRDTGKHIIDVLALVTGSLKALQVAYEDVKAFEYWLYNLSEGRL